MALAIRLFNGHWFISFNLGNLCHDFEILVPFLYIGDKESQLSLCAVFFLRVFAISSLSCLGHPLLRVSCLLLTHLPRLENTSRLSFSAISLRQTDLCLFPSLSSLPSHPPPPSPSHLFPPPPSPSLPLSPPSLFLLSFLTSVNFPH